MISNKIESMQEVLYYLHQYEIVYSICKQKVTYFAKQKDYIVAKSNNATYVIDENTLLDLFAQEDFYLHERKEDESSEEALLKDKEYYSWTHK